MARILVVAQPEYGHVLPMIPILVALRCAGHEIVVMSTEQLRSLPDRHQLGVELWTEENEQPHSSLQSGYSFWYRHTQQYNLSIREFVMQRLANVVETHQPDFYIFDSLMTLSYGIDPLQEPFRGRVVLLGTLLPRWDATMLRMQVPLLFLCPADFEVPRFLIRHPLVHYVEPSCGDLYDADGNNEFSSRPMVLTAFGTQSSLQRSFVTRIHAMAAAAKAHTDVDFIVGLNEPQLEVFQAHGGVIPENMSLVTRMPQRSFLKKASAFITHGGLSSIKEAILLGVPMIVTPEVFDQPFNAMRAVHHGLAQAVFPEELESRGLAAALEGLLKRSHRNESIETFQGLFREADAHPRAAGLIQEAVEVARSNRRL